MQLQSVQGRKKRKALFLLIIGIILLVFGVASLLPSKENRSSLTGILTTVPT